MDASELVILSVRPDPFRDGATDARDRTLVSVMAGGPVRVQAEGFVAQDVVDYLDARASSPVAGRIRTWLRRR